MFKLKALIVAGLLLGTPAAAQNAPSGLTAEGKQVYQERMKSRSAALAPLLARKASLQKQFDALVTPEGYDEEKLAATMAEMRSVEGEIVEKIGTSLLALIKALPEGDRTLFLASLSKTPPKRAAVSTVKPGEGR